MHLFPVAHGVGVGRAVQRARAHEIVQLVVQMLFRKLPAETVGGLFGLRQILRQGGVELGIVFFVIRKFAVVVHQPVGGHKELELLVVGIADADVHLSGELGIGLVHKAEHPRAGFAAGLHGGSHLHGGAGHGRDHHEGALPHPAVAGGDVFGGVFGKHIQRAVLLHVLRGLQAACPGPAYTQPADVFQAVFHGRVHRRLYLSPERQSAPDAVYKFLLFKFYHINL